ncbi:MAG: cobyrinic acid a,c-diamide synthase [Gammaproteobacteria bacterium RBG_16_51_14]|nr:MAG: cobyrinic acid a,c-diamide synthase [Gammaproteobacteria bacterium RBG_16_51_14]
MKVLATYSIKGGVGKTAAAVNLAYLAASEGFHTLLWDLDPQGAASFNFRIKPKVKGGLRSVLLCKRQLDEVIKETDFLGLDLIPSDFSYRNLDLKLYDARKPDKQFRSLIEPLAQEYDFLFLDCAPSISLVSENVFRAADLLLVPLIPTPLSMRSYDQLLRYFRKSPVNHLALLPFVSMIDIRKRLHKETLNSIFYDRKNVMRAMIPYASQVELMTVRQAPLCSYDKHSVPALAFARLWEEIKTHL